MARREPDGETDVEVLAAEILTLRQRLADLEAHVAGKLPHHHDSRYVEVAGDTMTGDLVADRAFIRHDGVLDSQGAICLTSFADGPRLRARNNDYTPFDLLWSLANQRFEFSTSLLVDGDFDATGAKNALVNPEDPDHPNRRYRFSATESDRPGVIEHEVELDTGTTYLLPAHWPRIATNLRCYLQPLSQGAVWPDVDPVNWTVTPRGQPGKVLALIRADRADAAVASWAHEVEVASDDEDDVA